MTVANRHCQVESEIDTLLIVDHFWQDQSDINAVDTVTDSGTVAIGDAASGQVVLTPSDGSIADNDEAILATPNEVFLFASGKNLYGRTRLKYAETVSGTQNIGFGFMNAPATDPLGDNGAGAKVSGSTLAVYKVDGETVWRFATANNSASTITKSNKAAVGATWYDIEIFGVDNGDGTWVCTAKVDGELLKDVNNQVIRHTVTIASATEMAMFAAVKLGAGTNNDALTLDLWLGKQKAF